MENITYAAVSLFLLFGVMFILMRYLQEGKIIRLGSLERAAKGPAQEPLESAVFEQLRMLEEEIQEVHHQLWGVRESLKSTLTDKAQMTAGEQQQVVQALKAQLQDQASESILSEIQQRVQELVKKDSQLRDMTVQFAKTVGRLEQEVSALTRRGNLNLALGIMTTVIGLAILGYIVFSASISLSEPNPWSVAAYYLPRITLVIFLEVFAYFFLRLYKASLMDIKYFQNEMTNVEAKYVAARLALGSSDDGVHRDVISTLSKTERNYVLNKGQTTVDLELEKIERGAMRESLKALSDAVQGSKKQKS